MVNAKYLCQKIVKDGSDSGLIVVPTTKGFMSGAVVYVSADGGYNKQLIIDEIVDENKLALKEYEAKGYTRYNCSHIKTHLHPKITQPEQFVDKLQLNLPEYEGYKKSGVMNLEDFTENEKALYTTISLLNKRIEVLEKRAVFDDKKLKIYKSNLFKLLAPIVLPALGGILGFLMSRGI